MKSINKLLPESSLSKYLLITIIGIFGLACGIKVGHAFVQPGQEYEWRQESITEELLARYNPTINIGDNFPPESYLDKQGITRSFFELIKSKTTLLVFLPVKLSWNNKESNNLNKIIEELKTGLEQVILCYDFKDLNNWNLDINELDIHLKIKCDINSFFCNFEESSQVYIVSINAHGIVSDIISLSNG